jgi:hypothetical protein
MSAPADLSLELSLPPDVNNLIGELFFIDRLFSSECSMWFACVVVSPQHLPTKRMATICSNFYSNVSIVSIDCVWMNLTLFNFVFISA